MQFIDLTSQQKRIRKRIDENMNAVLNHGKYIMGPEVAELEKELATFSETKHAVSCSSGTDALLLALMAMGVGPGDAVFTTPCTFIATVEVICLLGATPVFVDIDSKTFNLDPEQLEAAILAFAANKSDKYPLPAAAKATPLTPKGIVAVDLFGLPADYEQINTIARKYDLFVIGDAAQSLGAEIGEKKACSFPDIACTSFFPAKPLGCYGDGGMCFTDNDDLADVMRSLRLHGKGNHKYDNVRIGVNARLDTLQAAILLAKFEIYPEEIGLRQEVVQRYGRLLSNCTNLTTPLIPETYLSVWAQYSILAQDSDHRGRLQATLKDAGIPTVIYYPKPLHLQTAFAKLSHKEGNFPVGESTFDRIFSLPMHPYLSESDQEKIAEVIASVTS